MASTEFKQPSAVEQINDLSALPTFEFAFADFLRREHRFGFDSRPACKSFLQGHCPLGDRCPDKHQASGRGVICKHWLRGLCKKGNTCEFLHEYNLREAKECDDYSRFRDCNEGADCLELHIDPFYRQPPCEHYERGFCPLGPYCAARHDKKKAICRFYLSGFCPNGRECQEGAHPPWHAKEEMREPRAAYVLSESEKREERERLAYNRVMTKKREEEERRVNFERSYQVPRGGRGRGKRPWIKRGR